MISKLNILFNHTYISGIAYDLDLYIFFTNIDINYLEVFIITLTATLTIMLKIVLIEINDLVVFVGFVDKKLVSIK